MLSIIRNHSFVVIFFIMSIIMGLLFIFNLTEEKGEENMMGNKDNIFVEQTQSSQEGEHMLE